MCINRKGEQELVNILLLGAYGRLRNEHTGGKVYTEVSGFPRDGGGQHLMVRP